MGRLTFYYLLYLDNARCQIGIYTKDCMFCILKTMYILRTYVYKTCSHCLMAYCIRQPDIILMLCTFNATLAF